MKKVKIEVPEEFSVFLNNAVKAVEDPALVPAVTDNMAKFRYYLRARRDELEDMNNHLKSDPVGMYVIERTEALKELEKSANIIYETLLGLNEDN